jgi:hypothetical protein
VRRTRSHFREHAVAIPKLDVGAAGAPLGEMERVVAIGGVKRDTLGSRSAGGPDYQIEAVHGMLHHRCDRATGAR